MLRGYSPRTRMKKGISVFKEETSTARDPRLALGDSSAKLPEIKEKWFKNTSMLTVSCLYHDIIKDMFLT